MMTSNEAIYPVNKIPKILLLTGGEKTVKYDPKSYKMQQTFNHVCADIFSFPSHPHCIIVGEGSCFWVVCVEVEGCKV